jgi:hypothetical protein
LKLSDAIQAGAAILKTPGPAFVLRNNLTAIDGISQCEDALTCAQIGILGRRPSIKEHCQFYWDNRWKIVPGSDLELWLRLTAIHHYRWAEVLARLREYGA